MFILPFLTPGDTHGTQRSGHMIYGKGLTMLNYQIFYSLLAHQATRSLNWFALVSRAVTNRKYAIEKRFRTIARPCRQWNIHWNETKFKPNFFPFLLN